MARAPFPKALFAAESVKGPERACVQVIAMAGHGAEDPMGRAQVSIRHVEPTAGTTRSVWQFLPYMLYQLHTSK